METIAIIFETKQKHPKTGRMVRVDMEFYPEDYDNEQQFAYAILDELPKEFIEEYVKTQHFKNR